MFETVSVDDALKRGKRQVNISTLLIVLITLIYPLFKACGNHINGFIAGGK